MAVVNRGRGRKGGPSLKEKGGKVVFFHDWCKRCNICVSFCPKQALALDGDRFPYLAGPEQCSSCGLCQVLCPDLAVAVPGWGKRPKAKERSRKSDGEGAK